MKIYLDMDDVVADWMGFAHNIVQRNWNYGERIPEQDWAKVKAQYRMYRDLPVKEGAEDLVEWCRAYCETNPGCELYFLTALPHDYSMPWAAYDKVQWGDRYFPGIPVFIGPFSFDKWRHCQPGDILIDDRHSNCHEWRVQGGFAHEYRNWRECKAWLEETLMHGQST